MSRTRRTASCAIGVLLAIVVGVHPAQAQAPLEVWTAVSARGLVELAAADSPSDVAIRADATSRIVQQIGAGAPADVLVTADREWMREAVERGLVREDDAKIVAYNRLALITAAASPDEVTDEVTAEALGRRLAQASGPALAVGGPSVPVGRYARQALARLGLTGDDLDGRLVTVGSARAVVNTILVGEVEVGIGYRSDAAADPGVRVAGLLPADSHDPAEVWAAPLVGAPPAAADFVEALVSNRVAAGLPALGFDAPPTTPGTAPGEAITGAASGAGAPAAAAPALGPVLGRTIVVGLLAVLLATLPALIVGRWLARTRSRVRGVIGTLLLLPLVLPPVVTGFVLLALVGSSGLLGGVLGALGIRLSFTLGAAVVAAAVVGFPLYAVVVRNAFEAVDPRYEELAWTLGAPPRSTFRRVALPLALPGIAAGAVLALARGLGEFGATVVVAGNIEGRTQTLALAVYQLLESPSGRERIWLFVLASVVIAAVGLALWEWLGARHRARLLDGGRG